MRQASREPGRSSLTAVLDVLWHGLRDAFLMGWKAWWALVFGFFISAIVQAWVPRERIERALSGRARGPSRCDGPRRGVLVLLLRGGRDRQSLFQKGASAASAPAFQFASTNLVWELGLVLWALIGWQFTLAEYLGGITMIVLMAAGLRLVVSRRLEEEARVHAREAETGHQHHMAGEELGWPERLTSASAWSDRAQLPRRLADALEGDRDRVPARRRRRPDRQRVPARVS